MSSYWNQSRPHFSGEPVAHVQAKEKTSRILRQMGYTDVTYEAETPFLKYRGRWQKFPIDARYYDKNRERDRVIFIQFDGGYHREGKHVGKTKNRTEVQEEYASTHGYGYVVLNVDDVLSQNKKWILIEIWKQLIKQRENFLNQKRQNNNNNNQSPGA